jgi:hypothetical protein
VSWVEYLSSGRTLAVAGSLLLAVALPATLFLDTTRHGPEVRRSEGPPRQAPGSSLPIGRWQIRAPQEILHARVTELEFLRDGRFTGTTGSPGVTTVLGSWGGATGRLSATGESATRPSFRFVCDLVYVQYTRSPQSSYVIADCHSPLDRWTWELTAAGSGYGSQRR